MWIVLAIFAALMNAVRLGLQKHLNKGLSVEIVTWARYGFGLPFVLLYLALVCHFSGTVPAINTEFLMHCTAGGVAQIGATILLVILFKHRNFAIGVTYSKTEAAQTALIGIVLFGETVSPVGMLAILLGVAGVIIISTDRENVRFSAVFSGGAGKSALIGISSGFGFALSGLFIRNATLALDGGTAMVRAAVTLAAVVMIQLVVLGLWILYKNRRDFMLLFLNMKTSVLIGFTSVLGSVGMFTALALAQAAYVKTVTQVGIIFAIMITHKCFKEKISRQEGLGIFVLIGGVILLSFFR